MRKKGQYEIYKDVTGRFRWRLRNESGKILCISFKQFEVLEDCEENLEEVMFCSKTKRLVRCYIP